MIKAFDAVSAILATIFMIIMAGIIVGLVPPPDGPVEKGIMAAALLLTGVVILLPVLRNVFGWWPKSRQGVT